MNKILIELTDKLSAFYLALLSMTFSIFVCLLIISSTIQVNSYFTNVEAQTLNNSAGNSNISNNNNTTAVTLANNTLDIGSNNTIQDLTLPQLFERAEKSVVQVTTTSGADEPDLFRSGIGSGFVYNNDGLIITNYHVVAPSIRPPGELIRGETNDGVDINVAFEDGT